MIKKGCFVFLFYLSALTCSSQSHSFEAGYTIGTNTLHNLHTHLLNMGACTYKYIGRKSIGFSVAIEVSGYNISYKSNTGTLVGSNSTNYASVKDVYLNTPLMVEFVLGKGKVRGIVHLGVSAKFSLTYSEKADNFTYSHVPPYTQSENYYSSIYPPFKLILAGFPAGLGVKIPLSKLLYMNITLENRLFFSPYSRYLGTVNNFGAKMALGFNVSPKTKRIKE
jgi:hypothetical protein